MPSIEENNTLTGQITSADKSIRGKLCYPVTQPIWWAVLPARWIISLLAGFVFGKKARTFLWRKILTPANFLSSARLYLLGWAISVFLTDGSLAFQTNLLFIAIITDFFDGPLARNNNEVTELGTYLDHIGDWSVVLWVVFLNFYYESLSPPYLFVSLAILPAIFFINIAKFKKFYDSEISLTANAGAFAMEELQTDAWGRLQFGCLAVALFGGLFTLVSHDPAFFFSNIIQSIPEKVKTFVIGGSLALYLYIGGYSTRDALDYSEAKIKKFRQKLRNLKNGS